MKNKISSLFNVIYLEKIENDLKIKQNINKEVNIFFSQYILILKTTYDSSLLFFIRFQINFIFINKLSKEPLNE